MGRTSFYNFTIRNQISGTNLKNTCTENCDLCHQGKCLKCKSNYNLIVEQNACELEFNNEGYYYDEDNFLYRKCHQFCKTCSKRPKYYNDILEIVDTNCENCIDGYFKEENTNNCISKDNPPMYHYFNETLKQFMKCAESCFTCNQSQVNSTYFGCTSCDEISILYPESTNCLNCFARNKYISPYFNECLDGIPEGYFLEDPENKILGLCYQSCKTCNIKGDEINHQCTSCKEDYAFMYKSSNCYNDCPNNSELDENNPETKICICKNLYYIQENKIYCINDENCPENFPLKKENSNECILECNLIYKLQCYTFCPVNTFSYKINEWTICLDIINDNVTLEMLNLDEYSIFSIFNTSLDIQENIIIDYYPDIDINIYPSNFNIYDISANNSKFTFIDLDKCEEELKKYYNLDKDEILYIISAEITNPLANRVSNKFIFYIYLKNGTKLEDLSICYNKSAPFSVTSSISDLNSINYDEAQIFYSQGYNIYNINSEFYTDGCSPAKIGSNDIPLQDRKLIFPSNVSFCPENCDFIEVMIDSKRIRCSCDVYYIEEYVNISTNFIKVNAKDNFFIYLIDNFNYKIFKCYEILFRLNFNELLLNIGFIFSVAVFIINLICIIIFYFSALDKLRIQVYKSLPESTQFDKIEYNHRYTARSTNKLVTRRKTVKKTTIYKNLKKDYINSNINEKQKKFNSTRSRTIIIKKKRISMSYSRKESDEPIYPKSEKSLKEKIKIENKSNNDTDNDYNYLPFTEALRKDHRNFFITFFSILKLKMDIISLLFFQEDFTTKSYTLSMYFLDLLFEFFGNSTLYTDDVVSEKYHNNGKLNLLTSLFLSLTSNLVSFIFANIFQYIFLYAEYFAILTKEIKRKQNYLLVYKKLYLVLKIKATIYYLLSFLSILFMAYYLVIFCSIYKESQISLLINYIMSIVESIIISICITIIISVLRYMGLQFKNKYLYRTSIFLNKKL